MRLALPWLRKLGWSATVLCVDPQFVPVPQDPILCQSVPGDVEIVRVSAIPLSVTRPFGIGSLTLRSRRSLRTAGDQLLRTRVFDLVYFSTTEFGVFQLGPRWLEKFKVPYVLDYQDPWITDYYRANRVRPPGGRIKHEICQTLARLREPRVVRNAAHITTVSPTYAEQLARQYGLPKERTTVLPFGGASTDFAVMEQEKVPNPIFAPGDGLQHWLYAGVAGPYMRKSVAAILKAFHLALQVNPSQFARVRLHFVGTDYATGLQAEERILPIARELGLLHYVTEQKARIPYFQVLRCLKDADALLVPGSNEPGYTASKLYPYILAEKPLLTVFHESSSVGNIMTRCRAGVSITFQDDSTEEDVAKQILPAWFLNRACELKPSTDWKEFKPYTSEQMTKILTKTFDTVTGRTSPKGFS